MAAAAAGAPARARGDQAAAEQGARLSLEAAMERLCSSPETLDAVFRDQAAPEEGASAAVALLPSPPLPVRPASIWSPWRRRRPPASPAATAAEGSPGHVEPATYDLAESFAEEDPLEPALHGFEIFAFPCNQFGAQELGIDKEIVQIACMLSI
ncbi:uncharacterized protein LOC119275223 [Triticum dicoccoides]|uniref:uncharacterized protein LOC119275223 n=1 Tax=Triticum dicoccoides TaxID=85692 RepID=UPI00188DE052|nr:uncharacterized protein LOC119275223 [Triticum dicoccoides]